MCETAIGIVGGMSPESTVTYYQHIVRLHQQRHGDHRYPRIVIASVSFEQYVNWQHEGAWDRIAEGIQGELDRLAAAGAGLALLATNTMHKVLPEIRSPIPVLSILDAVAGHGRRLRLRTLGLTGTRFTMADGFYARGLEERGFELVLPTLGEQESIHGIIHEELIAGRVSARAIDEFGQIASALEARGAEAVLLACTELELLTRSGRIRVPPSTPRGSTLRLPGQRPWAAPLVTHGCRRLRRQPGRADLPRRNRPSRAGPRMGSGANGQPWPPRGANKDERLTAVAELGCTRVEVEV